MPATSPTESCSTDGAVDDNLIEANHVTRNGGDGIQIDIQRGGRPVGNVVRRNFTLRNVDDGIDSRERANDDR